MNFSEDRNITIKNGRYYELITCSRCNKETEIIDPKARKREVCDSCKLKHSRLSVAEHYEITQAKTKTKDNTCRAPGCSRFKKKGNRFLCDVCYRSGPRDIIFDQHSKMYC